MAKTRLFEFIFICFLVHLKKNPVAIILLEVGLGGRLDACNAIENDIFYIFTEMGMKNGLEARHEAMLNGIDALKQFFKKNNLSER